MYATRPSCPKIKAVAINIPHGVALYALVNRSFASLLVAACHRDPGVTTFTQRHEVARIMGAAASQRQDVMYFLRRRQAAFQFTLLAQRM